MPPVGLKLLFFPFSTVAIMVNPLYLLPKYFPFICHILSGFFFFLPSIQFIFSILFWYSFPSEHGSDNIHGSSALKEKVVAAFQSCVYVQRTLWICFSFPVIFGFCSRNACSVLKALFFSLGSSMLTSHDI